MDIFYALSDPTRRTIVEVLAADGKLSASSIAQRFKISAPAISQHLKILKEVKLVHMEKNAQQRIYQLNPAKLTELDEWINRTTLIWEERFNSLERLLKEDKEATNGKN